MLTNTSRLESALRAKNDLKLVPYIMAGHPTAKKSIEVGRKLAASGVAAIEIGIPHSDPLADGPVIQRAGQVALENGMTVTGALEVAAAVAKEGVPVVLMTYINPVLSHDPRRFAAEAAQAGVSGGTPPPPALERGGAGAGGRPPPRPARRGAGGRGGLLVPDPAVRRARAGRGVPPLRVSRHDLHGRADDPAGPDQCHRLTFDRVRLLRHPHGYHGRAQGDAGRNEGAAAPGARADAASRRRGLRHLQTRAHVAAAGQRGRCGRGQRGRRRHRPRRRRAGPGQGAAEGVPVRGIRGATTATANTAEEITDAAEELLSERVRLNDLDPEEIAFAYFTTTPDLNAEYPAIAARRLGWLDVPLLCGHAMHVPQTNPRSIPRCIRVLVQVNTDKPASAMKFVYLRRAREIQADLAALREAGG